MLQLTDIKLTLDHPKSELEAAILKRLGVRPEDLLGYSVFKRSYDARRKNDIKLIYTLTVEVKHEKKILRRKHKDNAIRPPQILTTNL